jgi:hypothetical protein
VSRNRIRVLHLRIYGILLLMVHGWEHPLQAARCTKIIPRILYLRRQQEHSFLKIPCISMTVSACYLWPQSLQTESSGNLQPFKGSAWLAPHEIWSGIGDSEVRILPFIGTPIETPHHGYHTHGRHHKLEGHQRYANYCVS